MNTNDIFTWIEDTFGVLTRHKESILLIHLPGNKSEWILGICQSDQLTRHKVTRVGARVDKNATHKNVVTVNPRLKQARFENFNAAWARGVFPHRGASYKSENKPANQRLGFATLQSQALFGKIHLTAR